jgi:hypothetical protein
MSAANAPETQVISAKRQYKSFDFMTVDPRDPISRMIRQQIIMRCLEVISG